MTVYPDFYPRFACRAGACKHSCCRGWEIDVDADSRRLYEAVPGPLGEKLRASLAGEGEDAHFLLTQDERCPFLQSDGLCELICKLGEEALCDICAEHPRFYLELGEHMLCGLGLSCEAACALLLADAGPLRFVAEESGETLSLSRLLGQPEASFSFSPRPEPDRLKQMLALFSRTEPIDAAWPKLLRQLEGALSELTEAACARLGVCSGAVYDRIGGYILYRQLDRLPEYGLDTLRSYAALCVDFVFLCETFSGDLAESLRRWSEQIEYSTDNPELLLRAVRG